MEDATGKGDDMNITISTVLQDIKSKKKVPVTKRQKVAKKPKQHKKTKADTDNEDPDYNPSEGEDQQIGDQPEKASHHINETDEEGLKKRKRSSQETSKNMKMTTRMSPKQLFDLIPQLTEEQRQAVKDIGFGGLLDLKISECPAKLCQYLIENLNVYRCAICLDNQELPLTEEDVQNVFDFPRGQKQVIEGQKESACDSYSSLLEKWRARWNVKGKSSPFTITMPEEIVKRGDHGDEFKRDFVVLVVSSLIKGSKTRISNYKILYSIADVNTIKDLNWCAYTLNSLMETIELWRQKPTVHFCGPTLFLMVIIVFL